VDADVTAGGTTDNPRVAVRVQVQGAGVDPQHGRAPALSKIAANLRATLADHRVDGTVDVEAPFAALSGRFGLPVDASATGAPVAVTLDVTRLDLGDVLRAGAVTAGIDGQAELHLRLTGSTGDPRIDLTAAGKDLRVSRPPAARATGGGTPTGPATTLDVGHARLHLTYATRKAGVEVNFASAHGGTLRVDAAASIDLSYPRVTRAVVVKKLPVRGKVVARSLNVAWLAQVNPRVESLGGQVSADASLTGTLGDPQFIGDVRWKNGGIVARTAPPAVSATNQPAPGL